MIFSRNLHIIKCLLIIFRFIWLISDFLYVGFSVILHTACSHYVFLIMFWINLKVNKILFYIITEHFEIISLNWCISFIIINSCIILHTILIASKNSPFLAKGFQVSIFLFNRVLLVNDSKTKVKHALKVFSNQSLQKDQLLTLYQNEKNILRKCIIFSHQYKE